MVNKCTRIKEARLCLKVAKRDFDTLWKLWVSKGIARTEFMNQLKAGHLASRICADLETADVTLKQLQEEEDGT